MEYSKDRDTITRQLEKPVTRSLIGFFAALLVGALIPRTTAYLIRQVIAKTFKELFVISVAGILTERIVHLLSLLLAGSADSPQQD